MVELNHSATTSQSNAESFTDSREDHVPLWAVGSGPFWHVLQLLKINQAEATGIEPAPGFKPALFSGQVRQTDIRLASVCSLNHFFDLASSRTSCSFLPNPTTLLLAGRTALSKSALQSIETDVRTVRSTNVPISWKTIAFHHRSPKVSKEGVEPSRHYGISF